MLSIASASDETKELGSDQLGRAERMTVKRREQHGLPPRRRNGRPALSRQRWHRLCRSLAPTCDGPQQFPRRRPSGDPARLTLRTADAAPICTTHRVPGCRLLVGHFAPGAGFVLSAKHLFLVARHAVRACKACLGCAEREARRSDLELRSDAVLRLQAESCAVGAPLG